MNTDAYRQATYGKGVFAAIWKTDPSHLIYDLCSEVESFQEHSVSLYENIRHYGRLIRGEGDYPKLLIHKGKHGDRHVLILDENRLPEAWLAMFRAMDQWDGFYVDLTGDQADWYEKAKLGHWQEARWLLDSRSSYEYEEVCVECIDTPFSLDKQYD